MIDVTSKTLEEYNIPPSGVIVVEESSIELTVGLPTGNEKVYSILKNKRVKDLKERVAVVSSLPFHISPPCSLLPKTLF